MPELVKKLPSADSAEAHKCKHLEVVRVILHGSDLVDDQLLLPDSVEKRRSGQRVITEPSGAR